jgi:hypothetical protein
MIFNWLKNAVIALLLHAGAAFAFNDDAAAPAAELTAPAQACSAPVQLSTDATATYTAHSDDTGAHS